jgi:hypothetical protein
LPISRYKFEIIAVHNETMVARFPLTLAFISLLLSGANASAGDDVVEMSFEGFGPAGVHVATTHTVIEETPASYLIQGDFETAGMGALFLSLANRSVAKGWQRGDVPHPQSFESETTRNGVLHHNHVDFSASGSPNGYFTPAPSEPVTPVAATQLPGTVDNLTAYLLVERQIAHGGGCTMRVPVYDGRHRYDLDFSDVGDAVLKPAAGQKFSGSAHECRMVRREIGGFYVDKSHDEGASSGTIWYAPLLPEADLAVPIRMEMQTEIGDVEIYLSQLKSRSVNLRLMQ